MAFLCESKRQNRSGSFLLRCFRLPDVLRDRRRHVLVEHVDRLECDPALETPLVLRPVDADVVDPRADDESNAAAAIVECATRGSEEHTSELQSHSFISYAV